MCNEQDICQTKKLHCSGFHLTVVNLENEKAYTLAKERIEYEQPDMKSHALRKRKLFKLLEEVSVKHKHMMTTTLDQKG